MNDVEHYQIEYYAADSGCYKNCGNEALWEGRVFRKGWLEDLGFKGCVSCGLQEKREIYSKAEDRVHVFSPHLLRPFFAHSLSIGGKETKVHRGLFLIPASLLKSSH